MGKFIPWNSQTLDIWSERHAEGQFIDLNGRRTHFVERGQGRSAKMHRLMPASRLEILDEAGHLANFDRPNAFNQLVTDFLRE